MLYNLYPDFFVLEKYQFRLYSISLLYSNKGKYIVHPQLYIIKISCIKPEQFCNTYFIHFNFNPPRYISPRTIFDAEMAKRLIARKCLQVLESRGGYQGGEEDLISMMVRMIALESVMLTFYNRRKRYWCTQNAKAHRIFLSWLQSFLCFSLSPEKASKRLNYMGSNTEKKQLTNVPNKAKRLRGTTIAIAIL